MGWSSRLSTLLTGPGIGASTIRDSGDIDVHIVTHSEIGRGRLPHWKDSLSTPRRLQGFALAVLLPAVLTVLLPGDRLRPDFARLIGDARFIFEGTLDPEATANAE